MKILDAIANLSLHQATTTPNKPIYQATPLHRDGNENNAGLAVKTIRFYTPKP
ncbi:hypothetical protein [Nostoc sp. 2RC]|uniref:hypothetical protein n=1 Tax=Nostoc sp. 2RC TaxID=2485484 RepID=UPI0016278F8E|nr:hypothetical protein [Nostoc sp. 2RC]MBC1238496.1 hypothetical protein [Nostoc sp. 2RC]MBC1238514.1 hypothetical protein [Nostoc sp. 2RC]